MFFLEDRPGERWSFTFELPSFLSGSIDSSPCMYTDSSAYSDDEEDFWMYDSAHSSIFWNPTTENILTADSTGVIAIGLGVQTSIPSNAHVHSSYEGSIVCTARRIVDGYTIMSEAGFYVSVLPRKAAAYPTDGVMAYLYPGESYAITPSTSKVIPQLNGNEEGQVIVFPLEGEPGGSVCLSFALPERIPGTYHSGTIGCSFPPGSARWKERDTLFDPNQPMLLWLDEDGQATIELGFSVTIPDTAKPDVYYSLPFYTVTYVGEGNPCHGAGIVSNGAFLFSIDVVPDERPKSFTLHQSYPNPVNGTATILVNLLEPSEIEIELYSLLGEKVRTIIKSFQYAGQHHISFSTDNLPSGVYFYRLMRGNTSMTRKLIIMR